MPTMKPYRDMHQKRLDRRRLWIRDPFACLGASFAIAGASHLSRMTLCNLDVALDLLAAGNAEIERARARFQAFGVWSHP